MSKLIQKFRTYLYQWATNKTVDENGLYPTEKHGEQTKNFWLHSSALTSTKISDSLIDPKLVLSWLFQQFSASSTMIGLLVPLREAGSLLPQLFIAKQVTEARKIKIYWVSGAVVQAMSLVGILLSILFLGDEWVPLSIIILLTVYSVARSYCSISYKATQGKTIISSTRGRVSGTAGTLSAVFAVLLAVLIYLDLLNLSISLVSIMIAGAALLWFIAAAQFSRLDELESEKVETGSIAEFSISSIRNCFSDGEFRRFIAVRGCLLATALTPPFLVMLLDTDSLGNQFALLLLASALANFLSSQIWGQLSDKSSRDTLKLAALMASMNLLAVYLYQLMADGPVSVFWIAMALFVAMVAHQGVRIGRSTHIVDMVEQSMRAQYTAVSNTLIGILLLFSTIFGVLADNLGLTMVFLTFSFMTFVAFLLARRLKKVQQ